MHKHINIACMSILGQVMALCLLTTSIQHLAFILHKIGHTILYEYSSCNLKLGVQIIPHVLYAYKNGYLLEIYTLYCMSEQEGKLGTS